MSTAGATPEGRDARMNGAIYPTRDAGKDVSHMLVDFPDTFAAPYVVLDTDYTTYSCVYSCIGWDAYKSEFGFTFSRQPGGGALADQRCARVFAQQGVDYRQFQQVTHDQTCRYIL